MRANEICGNCRFWYSNPLVDKDGTNGMCRRHPPRVSIVPGPQGEPVTISYRAQTPRNESCGEFQMELSVLDS